MAGDKARHLQRVADQEDRQRLRGFAQQAHKAGEGPFTRGAGQTLTVRALSYGTLYPALRDLLDHGLIAETTDPAGPSGRRPRVVYELTAAGKEHFAGLVARTDASAYEDDGFDVRFAFFARTERDVRLRILEGRRSRVEEDLERVREAATRSRERLDAYTTALQRHGEETTGREVRWLSELIDAERRHPTDPGPQP